MEDEYGNFTAQLCLPLHRSIGCKLASALMALRVPGAAWLYFRCAFGSGIDFSTFSVDSDDVVKMPLDE